MSLHSEFNSSESFFSPRVVGVCFSTKLFSMQLESVIIALLKNVLLSGIFSPKPLDSYPTSFSAGIFLILPDGVNELMGYGFSQLLRLIFFTQIVTKCIVA